jgi:hypothetical protein
MGAERKYEFPRTVLSPPSGTPKASAKEDEHENQPREIKIGKMIFYVTVALSLWFFYWFNGIQCPC